MMTELWKSDANWFATWFNTSAYHTLYGHRNEEEAEQFIDRLARNTLKHGHRVLDLGCGAGRHAASLNRLGYETVGLDLSANSIESAKNRYQGQTQSLEFVHGDMRKMVPVFQAEALMLSFRCSRALGISRNRME